MTTARSNPQKAIADALGVLALTLGEDVTEERQFLYVKILSVFAVEDVLAAISQAVGICKFFPRPAEIIELIKAAHRAAEKDPALAWEELLDAIRLYDYTSDVQFDDGAIVAAVRGLGGWEYICNLYAELSNQEMVYQRIPARFQALYREAVRAGLHRSPGIVYGFFTHDNRSKGLDKEFPQPLQRARTMAEIMTNVRPKPSLPGLASDTKALEFKPQAGTEIPGLAALAERMAMK